MGCQQSAHQPELALPTETDTQFNPAVNSRNKERSVPRSPERYRPGRQETKWYLVALGQLKSELFLCTSHHLEPSTIPWFCEERLTPSNHQEVLRKPVGLQPAACKMGLGLVLVGLVLFVTFPRKLRVQ